MTEREGIIQAIVALNFNEPEKALDILFQALSDATWAETKSPAVVALPKRSYAA